MKQLLIRLLQGKGVQPDDYVYRRNVHSKEPLNEQSISHIFAKAAKAVLDAGKAKHKNTHSLKVG